MWNPELGGLVVCIILVVSITLGLGVLLGAASFRQGLNIANGKSLREIVTECEKDLPRTQTCVLYAKPKDIK